IRGISAVSFSDPRVSRVRANRFSTIGFREPASSDPVSSRTLQSPCIWLTFAQVVGVEPTIDGFGVRPHSPICCTYFKSSGTSKVSIPKRHAFNDAFYNAGKRPTSLGSVTTCSGRASRFIRKHKNYVTRRPTLRQVRRGGLLECPRYYRIQQRTLFHEQSLRQELLESRGSSRECSRCYPLRTPWLR